MRQKIYRVRQSSNAVRPDRCYSTGASSSQINIAIGMIAPWQKGPPHTRITASERMALE